MKKERYAIQLNAQLPTVVRISEKYGPVGLVVDRVYAIVYAEDSAGNILSHSYVYFALKKPAMSKDCPVIYFDIESKFAVKNWKMAFGDEQILLEKILGVSLYVKTDATTLWLRCNPFNDEGTARRFYGIVTDNPRFRVTLQQISDDWFQEINRGDDEETSPSNT